MNLALAATIFVALIAVLGPYCVGAANPVLVNGVHESRRWIKNMSYGFAAVAGALALAAGLGLSDGMARLYGM